MNYERSIWLGIIVALSKEEKVKAHTVNPESFTFLPSNQMQSSTDEQVIPIQCENSVKGNIYGVTFRKENQELQASILITFFAFLNKSISFLYEL